jgi:uncharacterized membrane protein
MALIGTIRNCAATVSAGVALLLGSSSAIGGVAAALALAVLGRGPQAGSYVLLAHHYSWYVVLFVIPLGILTVMLGRCRLGSLALVIGVGAWLFASCLVPMSDASGR